MDLTDVIINQQSNTNTPTYMQTLIRVCDKIKNDNGWIEVKNGMLGDYFEIKSFNNTLILKPYLDDVESLGLKKLNDTFIRENPLYKSKFTDYKCIPYFIENEIGTVLFIYAAKETKNTLTDLRKEMLYLSNQLHEILNGKKIEIPSGKKPNEIIMLKIVNK